MTPPLPNQVPPPQPPPDERLNALPTQHATVKIALPKKPPTPTGTSPVSLLVAKDSSIEKLSEAERPRAPAREDSEPKVAAHKARRRPVQRTREEDKAAYGRIFQGCGMQSDYDVITKLGEGTFGYVFTFSIRPASVRPSSV